MDFQAFRLRAVALAAVVAVAGCAALNSNPPAPSSPVEPATSPSSGGSTVDLSLSSPVSAGASQPPAIKETASAAAPAPVAPAATAPAAAAPAAPAMQDAPETETSDASACALSAYPNDCGPGATHPVDFRDAVARAAKDLFKQAHSTIGTEPRLLVIDPLVDGATGQQTASTVEMGKILADLIKQKYPTLTPAPLTRAALAQKPVLFIGTLTPFNSSTKKSAKDRPADAFRVWLTLIDLRTGKVVAKSIDKATAGTVDSVPLSYYRDSPTWSRDKTVAAYINSCTTKTKIGDPADPAYLARLPAAAAINEAMEAYSQGHIEEANRLFRDAQNLADEDDLRILNGLYLTSWRLGQQEEARAAFDSIVLAGLHSQRLPLKFLFVPAKAELLTIGDLGSQYSMWLNEVAMEARQNQTCLDVVGHTSKTGTAAMNDALSYARANWIRDRLSTDAPALMGHLTAEGKGFRENLIGLGTDDLRDALDRRVELVVATCANPTAPAQSAGL